MRFEVVSEYPQDETLTRWNDFLTEADYATHYVTPGFFLDPFVGEGERFAVLALDGDSVVAALTGLRSGRSLQSGLAVRPQSAFAAGCDRNRAADALVQGLGTVAGDDVDLINFFSHRPIPGLAERGYTSRLCLGSDQIVVLDCSRGSEALFKDFGERRRRTLRSAMREKKLEVKTLETEAELLELYEIHTDWNRRKGRTPESFEKFQMAASLTDHRKIFLALHDGKVVAGTFFRFCRGGIIEGSANHSIPEYQKLAPNELIMWRAIEWACADGFKLFSMGASHHFLTKFGGEIVANYRYRSDRTILKLHNNRERLSRLAIRTYQSLPVSIRQGIKSVATRV